MNEGLRTREGGRIDRSRVLHFTFDGRAYTGVAGDTLASALLANGVHLLGRSFKYHRPRGVLASGAEEPNALVAVRRDAARYTPNLRATQVELYEGLAAHSQNRWPTLAFDLGAVNDLLAPFIPAGFYYKTFMWPRRAWRWLYEPRIRAAAGLGHSPTEADPDRYASRYAHCDVLVVGAGPAGLAAAAAAAASGARVMLCDEQNEFGGSLLADDPRAAPAIEGRPALQWLEETLATLGSNTRVTLLPRTTAFGYFPHNLLGLNERLTEHLPDPQPDLPRERQWQVRAREVVLATGAIERPLVFPGNDRPGIMLAGAARTWLNRYGVLPGTRSILLAQLQGGEPLAQTQPCDLVLMSGGFTPSVHLFSQSRGKLMWDEGLQAFLPGAPAERARSAGACRGVFGLGAALSDGAAAGAAAAYEATAPTRTGVRPSGAAAAAPAPPATGGGAGFAGALPQPAGPRARAFVDWQNDVTTRDLALATREGFRSIEHIKRYTTTGMATDQGKTSNLNALGIVSRTLGKPIPEVGLTTFRMPYTPVSFGSFAGPSRGELFDPVRTTPMHEWARARGAVFEDVGLWKRARYFPRGAEQMSAAVGRECLAVRNACGIFDASTLGKIEVVGQDAVTFMNRLYVNAWTSLAVGRCRYGLLLRDDGFVYDDGVVARVSESRFHVTTTTGGAPRVLAMMEDYLQTEWSDLKVWLTSTTEQWAVVAVQGPNARALLSALVDIDLTGEAHGITPYGTETMHVLRAEKGYIIVGQDTDGTVTPDDVGLGWAIGKNKPDFVGKRSLERPAMISPERRQLVGLLSTDPQAVLEEGAQVMAQAGARAPARALGHVTSSYRSSVLGRSIAMGLVAGGRARIGETLFVSVPAGDIPVQVASPVFYDPDRRRLHA